VYAEVLAYRNSIASTPLKGNSINREPSYKDTLQFDVSCRFHDLPKHVRIMIFK